MILYRIASDDLGALTSPPSQPIWPVWTEMRQMSGVAREEHLRAKHSPALRQSLHPGRRARHAETSARQRRPVHSRTTTHLPRRPRHSIRALQVLSLDSNAADEQSCKHAGHPARANHHPPKHPPSRPPCSPDGLRRSGTRAGLSSKPRESGRRENHTGSRRGSRAAAVESGANRMECFGQRSLVPSFVSDGCTRSGETMGR
ncbi:uncharacterized protein B0H18DRAFT_1079982 [Fomitopsis serialis]|uniref:uncharacterized protein n=1 Tax=Fomitopsis serialis TaxID=139415 RepID=UPI0020088C0F|nr:uncharacterized protein B0H18DRAFT_1079982 [Neoantrodia serialis]KAH9905560.1 hypothetical protein B0H18DRAFT_1079982 [Neoantrodia serialis]